MAVIREAVIPEAVRREAVLRAALRPIPGSLRLVLLRWLLAAGAALPALLAVLGPVREAAGNAYFTDPPGTLPLPQAAELVGELAPAAAGGIAVAALLVLVSNQLLTGGALALFDPARPRPTAAGTLRDALTAGLVWCWPLARVLAWTVGIMAGGAGVARGITMLLTRVGEREEWTGATLRLTLPLVSAGAVALWAAFVAAWGFWAKVITVADGRVRTRRTILLALRALFRRPLATAGFFAAVSTAALIVPALVLWGWRHAPPGSLAGAWGWFALAVAAQLVPALAWHWTVRAGRLVYAGRGFDDLRTHPDAPFRWLQRASGWIRTRRRRTG